MFLLTLLLGKKKKVYGFSSMAGRGNRSDAGLKNKFKPRTFMANDDLHGVAAASIVLLTHFFWKSLITLKVLLAKSEMALNVKQTQIFSFTMLGYIKGPSSLIIWDHYSKKIPPPCVITVLHQFLIAYKWAGL